MTVKDRIKKLRDLMRISETDAYIIPTDDFHSSEYVGEYFKEREYISGFTGSAGTVVVTDDQAGLWTDGRYFLQAAEELKGSGIHLFRMGEKGVPTIEGFLAENMREGSVIGFDGRTLTAAAAEKIRRSLSFKNIRFACDMDLVGEIWKDRPALSGEPAWILPTEYAGETRDSRISRVRKALKEKRADAIMITALDEIGWILNIRGNDIMCTPVVLAYLYISDEKAVLFTDIGKFSEDDRKELEKSGIVFMPYDSVYGYAAGIGKDTAVLVDAERVNHKLAQIIAENSEIVYSEDPVLMMKAVKNSVEVENMRKTHVKDGVAVTKLIYRFKNRDRKKDITEMDVAECVDGLRREQEGYIGPSFETISAYGPDGAVIHYTATEETNRVIEEKGFVLLDSGGTYMGGTTDVTRTIAAGELTEEEREHYTAVLKGNIDLADTVFPEGMCGINLDALARRPIWDTGCDFRHGTGHGVGYMLSVHEGPNSIRNRISHSSEDDTALRENMITSNEPGIYIEGSHGIRLETLILAVKCTEKTYVPMMRFETLTLVPFEREAIIKKRLTADEIKWLDDYHEKVYREISPFLDTEEREWLRKETAPL